MKAHTIISVINTLSIRYKYDCDDLYLALKKCVSRPIPEAFEKFPRIEQDSDFFDKISDAVRVYKTFDERDHILVKQCLMNFRSLDKRSNIKLEKVFKDSLIL